MHWILNKIASNLWITFSNAFFLNNDNYILIKISQSFVPEGPINNMWTLLVCDLNRTPIVMAKHGGPCVHFSGISTCGRTSRDTVSHPQHPPLPTLCKISLPVYVIVTNERLQPLTTTWYNSPVLSFPLLKIYQRLIKHRTFLRALHSYGSALSFADGAINCFTFLLARHLADVLR